MFILNRPARMIGAGIGFAKEYHADRKSQKGNTEDDLGQEEVTTDDGDDDGYEWTQAIDETQSEARFTIAATDESQSEENQLADFFKRHPPPPDTQQQPVGNLALPVILPQRRPHSRTRGWVRGYAPVLADAGVDQKAWFEFLDQFEQSTNNNNVFWAANAAVWVSDKIYLASTGNLWIKPIVWAVHLSIEAGRRGYVHNKHNKLLDEMNEQYFKPRGLYALIVKYKPDDINELGGWVDVRQNVTQSVLRRDDPNRSGWDNILESAADTVGNDAQVPGFAPLVFPLFNEKDEKQKENAWKHFVNFRQEYQDRGASAQFQAQNPESKLGDVAPQKEYASRYSNPNHPARQGLIGLVTGGKVNPKKGLIRGHGGKNDENAAAADDLTAQNTAKHSSDPGDGSGHNVAEDGVNRDQVAWQAVKGSGQRGLSRVLRQDALYLMVVNMPSEKELEAVKLSVGDAM